ncbi:hypothetical protein PTSG_02149 [Salpingoeca rosetta]|uniref:RING-type domain-containing protein n=1 Tax=Salpingoeca rosetta (strain ATCC 50818 / BSB-021) TaxID=946362 RepID=F2U1C6_SALR5|nr:uncharacterized protein PTSG_02149 [Salpingoeca rosetta]EGD81428.1 hypothetical protein PTSG_02149 [Salpingoeca rosetta]|eukprot:XP_004996632.1 hypothetical protein PTSG_02149 [Salpingoeca rosetta]
MLRRAVQREGLVKPEVKVELEEVDEYEREAKNNEECPRCRTTRMRQPNLKLFVGTCGHSLCEVCLNQVFHNTPSYPCIVCRALRLRADYTPKLFEDGSVHRNVVIRKDKLKDLNLSLDDFQGNTRKYNDYLEMKEDIVYNLEHSIDVDQTRRTLARFVERHKDAIAANKRRLERERHRQLQLKREQARIERARQEAKLAEIRRVKEAREKLRQQILEQLASTDDPTQTLLMGKKALLERRKAQMSMFKDTSHTYTVPHA